MALKTWVWIRTQVFNIAIMYQSWGKGRWVMKWPLLWIRSTLMRIRIQLIALMRIRILIFIWCGCGSRSNFSLDTDPDPDFYLIWIRLVTLMPLRIRIQVPKMMRIRIHDTGGDTTVDYRKMNIFKLPAWYTNSKYIPRVTVANPALFIKSVYRNAKILPKKGYMNGSSSI